MNRHALIMLLCFLVPLAILAVLWVIGISKFYLIFGVVLLLFLLMHIAPMIGMRRRG